jgi:hypothetical protein
MTYPGGKNGAGVYQQLINLMPPHHTYVEPFLGGGAILRLKKPARLNIGIDVDADVVARFRSTTPPELASPPAASLKLMVGSGIEFLKSHPWRGGELVYCDPPYLRSAISTSRPFYRHTMTDAEHADLLRTLRRLPPGVMVMLSGYHSEMYARALSRWRLHTFEAVKRSGRKGVEHVWMNYPEPLALHDYRYLGRDFRERERITRKKRRWRKKLEGMPALERYAILSEIEELGELTAGGGDVGRVRL